MRQRRCRNAPNSPQCQANVRRHHEKLKFMGLKEKQHLGRNYCDLKGGCGPVYKCRIWKRCLVFFFFFFKLIRIPVRKLWCDYLPDVQKKIVEDELHLGGIFCLSVGFTEHLLYARCTPSTDIFDAAMSKSGCNKSWTCWCFQCPFAVEPLESERSSQRRICPSGRDICINVW